jgi:hypothetical protein
MISGIRSLAEHHEQVVVAWTGNVHATTNTTSQSAEDDHAVSIPEEVLSQEDKDALEKQLENYSNEEDDAEEAKKGRGESRKGVQCVPVWLNTQTAKLHYEGYCKTSKLLSLPSLSLAFACTLLHKKRELTRIVSLRLTLASSLATFPLPALARRCFGVPHPRPFLHRLRRSQQDLCPASRRRLQTRRSHLHPRLCVSLSVPSPSPNTSRTLTQTSSPPFRCWSGL